MADLLVSMGMAAVLATIGWRISRLRPLSAYDLAPATAANVSVVIPARDEAGTLPTLLDSLARLTTQPAEVIVVDDASRDQTATIARDKRATVLVLDGPPEGWTGKAWACHRGAETAAGELLLFLDADTALRPCALDALLSLHHRHGGLISVQPYHDVVDAYEQLSAYFNAVSLLASGVDARRPARRAMAFGPCLLTSRDDYRKAGGHAAVRATILDDVGLAARYQRAGLPVRCAVGGALLRMRMYPGGVGQLVEGWTKNFASGASAAAPGPTAVAVLWVAVHHAVAFGALLAAVAIVVGHHIPLETGPMVMWALGWVFVAVQMRGFLRRIGSFRWWTWLLFPLPLLAFDAIFARSVFLTAIHRSVRWRGRDVRIGERTASTEEG